MLVKGRIRLALVALALAVVGRGGILVGPARLPELESSGGSSRRPRRSWPKATSPTSSLSARQALSLNPSNLVACQLMAGLAEMAGSPALLDWRRRIAEISPTPENRLLLASTALRLQRPPYPLTAQILDDLRAGATNLPAFHMVSAESGDPVERTGQSRVPFRGRRPARADQRTALGLTWPRCASAPPMPPSPRKAGPCWKACARARTSGAVALRSLATDCLRRQDFAAATAWSDQLVANPRCTTEDRLQHLDLLFAGQRAGVHVIPGKPQAAGHHERG